MDTTATASRWHACPRAAQAVQTVHRAAIVKVFQSRAERTNHAQLKQTKLDNKRTETDNRIKQTISIIHNEYSNNNIDNTVLQKYVLVTY